MIFMEASYEYFFKFMGQDAKMEIPIFQRAYSWKKDQFEELINDIIKIGKNKDDDETYFIGSIVFKEKIKNGKIKITIIDGQQRITTLVILACCLCKLKNIEEEEKNDLINKFIKTNGKTVKLNLKEKDNGALQKIINSINSDMDCKFDKDSIIIENAYENINKIVKKEKFENIKNGLNKICFVSIKLNDNDEPQLIFESLNSTGKNLSNSDLIRNYILMNSEKKEDLYKKYWEPIEIEFRKNNINDFDTFIFNYLIIKR